LGVGEGLVFSGDGEGLGLSEAGDGLDLSEVGDGLGLLDVGEGGVFLEVGEGLGLLEVGEGEASAVGDGVGLSAFSSLLCHSESGRFTAYSKSIGTKRTFN